MKLADGFDSLRKVQLTELHAAGATVVGLASAWGIPARAVRRRIHALGLERSASRTSLFDELPRADLGKLRPLIRRMRPTRPSPRTVAAPGRELLRRLPREIPDLRLRASVWRVLHAAAVETRADHRALLRDARARYAGTGVFDEVADLRTSSRSLRRQADALEARGVPAKSLAWVRERAREMGRVAENVVRLLVASITPPVQGYRWQLDSALDDLRSAEEARRSLTVGEARSWLAVDVAVALGYACRGYSFEFTDDELDEIAQTWGWEDREPTDGELHDAEVFEAALDDPDDVDDLDPVLEEATAPMRARRSGSWAPLPPTRVDQRTPVAVLNAEAGREGIASVRRASRA